MSSDCPQCCGHASTRTRTHTHTHVTTQMHTRQRLQGILQSKSRKRWDRYAECINGLQWPRATIYRTWDIVVSSQRARAEPGCQIYFYAFQPIEASAFPCENGNQRYRKAIKWSDKSRLGLYIIPLQSEWCVCETLPTPAAEADSVSAHGFNEIWCTEHE